MPRALPIVATAVRRDLLAALADPEALSLPAATAGVAAAWSERRRRTGLSPSSAGTAAALAFGMALEWTAAAATPATVLPSRRARS